MRAKTRENMGDITKLPKWAQEHIHDLEREREVAVKALNDYCDTQTPSPFRVDEMECTGEEQGPSRKVRYIQAHNIQVSHAGVVLDIYVRHGHESIDLQWSGPDNRIAMVGFIPTSFQAASLIATKNMRR